MIACRGGLLALTLLVGCSTEATGVGPDLDDQDQTPTIPGSYDIVDTGQWTFFDDWSIIQAPGDGAQFYGQDAHYSGLQPAYATNGDGTVTDMVTALMWQQTPEMDDLPSFAEAVAGAEAFRLGGYDDWRLPTIKELYSLIQFIGSSRTLTPYLDTENFDFRHGEESRGERVIDAQYWSATEYVGLTMNGDATVFGVNFADGRIKGYPRDGKPGGEVSVHFVRYVRGNPDYGLNDFVDNGDDTVSDLATGLMWQKSDDGVGRNWGDALQFAEGLELAGHSDWRLPNAKELQSIVDYTRAPDATSPGLVGPAINPVFDLSETESWFWTGTTLTETPPQAGVGSHAVYVAFGQATGNMFGSWINVHGAGAQRSDPKSGDPADWPDGLGPQGDEIRIFNFVRAVRTIN